MTTRPSEIERTVRSKSRAVRNLTQKEFASEYIAEIGRRWRDRVLLHEARAGRSNCWLEAPSCTEPLVTVRIATKDRPQLLVERSVASALRQTYSNIEVLIVGDGCHEATAAALSTIDDPRLRYVNLGRPGRYPSDPDARWRVAGSHPMNAGLLLAAGDWIAPCDDDDELTDDHVEKLLGHAKANNLEFVWSQSMRFGANGSTRPVGDSSGLDFTHGSIIYSMGLSFFSYSSTSHRMKTPSDKNLWWRMRRAGVRMGFLDEVTYKYWPAGSQQYEGRPPHNDAG